jgi:lysophospholipase L1-like esterase
MIRLKSLLFERKTESKPNVLFVGDSQTAANSSYANRLINNGIVTGKVVAKVGASMKRIYNLFSSVYKPGKYDIVCVLGGNNDAGNNNIDTDSFDQIIQTAKKGGSEVILITSPSMEFINKKMYPNDYPSANKIPKWQLTLAEENGIPVINSYELFDNPKYFSEDGLHLNSNAHKILAKDFIQIASTIVDMPIPDDKEEKDNKSDKDKSDIDGIKFGDKGRKVKLIQKFLIKYGYSVGDDGIDGIYGNKTQSAIKQFQTKNHIPVTGIVDDITYTTLMSKHIKKNINKDDNSIDEPLTSKSDDTALSIKKDTGIDTDTKSTKLTNIAANVIAPSSVAAIDSKLSPSQTATSNTIIDFFIGKGLTKEQSIGIAANLQAESGYRTGAIGDSGTSMGLAQWHNERMENLKSWTTENNLDPMSVNGQLEYLWHELNTTHKRAMNSIRSAKTPGQAAYAFTVDFEVPSNKHSKGLERAGIANGLANGLI